MQNLSLEDAIIELVLQRDVADHADESDDQKWNEGRNGVKEIAFVLEEFDVLFPMLFPGDPSDSLGFEKCRDINDAYSVLSAKSLDYRQTLFKFLYEGGFQDAYMQHLYAAGDRERIMRYLNRQWR
jgi:hypothetical protein